MYLVLVHHWSHSFGQTEAGEHYSYGQRVEAVVPLKDFETAWPFIEATCPKDWHSVDYAPWERSRNICLEEFKQRVQQAKDEIEAFGKDRVFVAYAYMTAPGSSQGERWYLYKDSLLLEQGTHYDSANLAYQRAILGR